MKMIKSCYIHIPFCKSICAYCDFCKMLYNEKFVDKYLSFLKKEIIDNYKNEKLKTIYIGGGSPSALSKMQLLRLFSIIKLLKKEENCEITIEANINDLELEKLKILKDNGVNRISIGVESINKAIQKLINREYSKELVKEKILLARKYFSNINIDLMYGFYNENIDILKADLDFITSLNPEHISIYSLQIEENTLFYINNVKRVDDDLDFEMYKYICKYLKEKGYNHYEISNFAKEGFSSIHNLTYWNNSEYYGFGLGASGYVNKKRYSNTRSLNNYFNGKILYEKIDIDKNLDMEYEMILGLRKLKGVNKDSFYKKFNCHIDEVFDIIDLVNKNLIIDDGTSYRISEDNLYVSNSILEYFVGGCK